FWQVGIKSFRIEKEFLPINSKKYRRHLNQPEKFSAIIDSGSVQFRFPSAILKEINEAINATCSDDQPDVCTVDCGSVSDLPDFTISFDTGNGQTIDHSITPSDYILPESDSQCVSAFGGFGCDHSNKTCNEPKNLIVLGM
ncbi:hypothetical protein HK096_003307, partial [Nowakowskiella sp. JEL0078]